MSDISPEIAAMLADVKETDDAPTASASSSSNNELYMEVDLTRKGFAPIDKYISDTDTTQSFSDKNYYKTVLSNENEMANRVHQLLSKYLKCDDPKDKTVFRQQIITPYWELMRSVAQKLVYPDTPECKRLMLRYGVLLPSLFTQEQRQLFSRAFIKNTTGEPVYYIDEWLNGILKGKISPSATDEARKPAGKPGSAEERARLNQLKTKNQGKVQQAETMIQSKENERQNLENTLAGLVERFSSHDYNANTCHKNTLTEEQKRLANDMCEKI